MQHPIKVGVSFGLTSSVITLLGLMVGLHSSTHSLSVILGGILIIAFADALADATGIHMSEEAENKHSSKQIWTSTASAFFTKFSIALTFLIPIMLFPLTTAILISIAWGLLLIAAFTYYITRKKNPLLAVMEHLAITVVVIILTHFLGKLVNYYFV